MVFLPSWGQFHKTLQIRKLRICSYGQILTINLLINCKNYVIYGHFAVNYEEKSFVEQVPGPIEGHTVVSLIYYQWLVWPYLLLFKGELWGQPLLVLMIFQGFELKESRR